jgi:uncharacterized membrane protein YbjE (DUF340 family)
MQGAATAVGFGWAAYSQVWVMQQPVECAVALLMLMLLK